jgi:ribose transport system permease protein
MTAVAAVTMFEGVAGTFLGIFVTLLTGVLVGLVMGLSVTFGRLPDIIVTLAFSYIWSGVALLVLSKPGGHIPPAYARFMSSGGIFPFAILFVLLMLIVWKMIKNTRVGINLYAIGGNSKAAFESGINVRRTKIIAYMLSGLFLAAAGLMLVGQTGCGDPTIGDAYGTKSIAAVILGGFSFAGGVGQMSGAVLGAFIYIAIENILFFSGLSSFYQYIIQGAILIAAIGLKAIAFYRKGGDRA